MTSTFHCPQKLRMVILKVLEYYGKNTGSDLRIAAAVTLLLSVSVMDDFLENLRSFFSKTVFKTKLTS